MGQEFQNDLTGWFCFGDGAEAAFKMVTKAAVIRILTKGGGSDFKMVPSHNQQINVTCKLMADFHPAYLCLCHLSVLMTQRLDFHRASDPGDSCGRNCSVFYDLASEVTLSTIFCLLSRELQKA